MQTFEILKNIRRNYLYTFITSAGLTQSIWMLYLAYRGMSLIQIGIIESIFHITSMTMELPTGIIADRFGRKKSRLLSSVMGFMSACILLTAHDFWLLAFGFAISAIGYNLESGAGDALLYDSLIQGEAEERYYKIRGIQEACFQSARGLGMVIGGMVAQYSYELAYAITAGMHIVSFLVATRFEEPTVGRKTEHQSLKHIFKESLSTLKTTHGVLKYMLLSEIFALFYVSHLFYFQNFLKDKGFQEGSIGLFLASAAVFGIAGSNLVDRLQKRFKQRNLLMVLFLLALCGFAGISFTSYEPLAMMFLAGIEGSVFVLFSGLINARIPSEQRATLLSLQSMIYSILMILWFPVMGAIIQYTDFKTGFRAVFILATISVVAFIFRKEKN